MKKALKSVVALVFCFMMLASTAVFSSAISAVTNLKATNVIYNSATLTWSKVKNADGYQVRPYVDKKYGKTVDNKKETTYKAKLTPGKSYYFYVRAYDKKLKGFKYVYEYSSWQKVAVKAVPAKVTGLKATQSGTTVKLSWTKVPSITGYVVQQYKNGKYTNIKTLSYKYTSLNVAKQPYGSTQQFRVVAYVKYNSKNIYGSYSSAVKLTLKPGVPSSISVSEITASSGKLSWKAVTGATGYQVYRYSASKKAYVKVANTSKTYLTVTGLYAATNYKFQIRAYTKYGSAYAYGSWSSAYAFTTVPSKITGVKASDATDSSCVISWTANKVCTGYQVYRYSASKKAYVKVANTSKTSLTVTGLYANTTYKFKVRGYLKNGSYYYSGYSSVVSCKTRMAAPVITSTYDGTLNEYTLSWKAVSGATEYVLERYNNSNYTWDEIARGAERTFTDKNNVVRAAVLYRVRAFDANGAESMPAKGTTASTSILTVTKDAYSATITWGDIENYNVKDGVNVEKKINKYTILTKPINKHNDIARPWFTTATITSSDLDSFKFNLTPGAVNSFMIYAWEEGSSVPYTLGPIDVDADELTVNTTDNSKTAQVLNYINAVNKTKAETGKLTVKNTTAATMNLEALLIDGDINNTGESNAATALWNVISGDGVITGEEIQDFLELAEKLGVIDDSEVPEINKTETYTETLVFENGIAKTENGNKSLRLYIEPSSSYIDGSKVGLAYLYDQHNAAAWKNGFSSVSTSYYSDGRIKFTATLKQEKFGTSVNKEVSLYHPGLVSTIDSGSLSSSAGSVNELTTVGATTITAVINTDGTLNSLTVKSPFETKFFESAGEGLSLGMEMSGSTNTSYTFTR